MGERSFNDIYDRDTFNSPELYHGIRLGEPCYNGDYLFRVLPFILYSNGL